MDIREAPAGALTDSERAAFRYWLQREFAARAQRTPLFGLRSFARLLSVEASSLSQLMNGQRPFSKKMMAKICDRLDPSEEHLKEFGLLAQKQAQQDPRAENYKQIAADIFASIADWYHYALLELTMVKGFVSDAKWIAKSLAITTQEAKIALERLTRLGLLAERTDGQVVKANSSVTNQSSQGTSQAHKELQRHVITKALAAIDQFEPSEKDITSMTMAVNEKNLPAARELIKQFRRDMSSLLETGPATRVFHLGVQLYPVSRSEEDI